MKKIISLFIAALFSFLLSAIPAAGQWNLRRISSSEVGYGGSGNINNYDLRFFSKQKALFSLRTYLSPSSGTSLNMSTTADNAGKWHSLSSQSQDEGNYYLPDGGWRMTLPHYIKLSGYRLSIMEEQPDGVWKQKAEHAAYVLYSSYMFSNDYGYFQMISDSGKHAIYKYDMGVITRSSYTTPFTSLASAMSFPSASTGYLLNVGYGRIYKTTDSARTWTEVSGDTTMKLNALYFLNDMEGYCCGQNGTIIKTTDGGKNWTKLSTGSTAMLNSITFAGKDNGIAVGNSGTILRITNGGQNVNTETSGVTADLYRVCITPDGYAYIFIHGVENFQYLEYKDIVSSVAAPVSSSVNMLHTWPSPCSTSLSIEWNNTQITAREISVTDMQGRTFALQIESVNNDRIQLNTSDLAAGIYSIQVQAATGIYTAKFVKD